MALDAPGPSQAVEEVADLDDPPPLETIPAPAKKLTPKKKQLASKIKKATPTKKSKK